MPKLDRIFFELFGKDGVTNDFAQFGSKAAGVPLKTKNILTIQALDAWKNGIKDAILAGVKAPFLEDMNSFFLVSAYMMGYVFEAGIPEWEANTTYFVGSYVRAPGGRGLYTSKVDDNLGNSLPSEQDDNFWRFEGGGAVGYRRPVLQWNDADTVNVEAQGGAANQTRILFPDGSARTVTEDLASTQKYRQFDVTKTAEFTTGTESGGLRSGLSPANNAWYSLYAVKSQINPANFVIVGDTTPPVTANVATLNSRYGTAGWLYLGSIYRTNAGLGGFDPVICDFVQTGSKFEFRPTDITNPSGPITISIPGGTVLGSASFSVGGTTNVTFYSPNPGMGSGQVPPMIKQGVMIVSITSNPAPAVAVFSSMAILQVNVSGGLVMSFPPIPVGGSSSFVRVPTALDGNFNLGVIYLVAGGWPDDGSVGALLVSFEDMVLAGLNNSI